MRTILRWIVGEIVGEQQPREEGFYCGRCACYVLIPERHYYHAAGGAAGALPYRA